jgi:hypothetical protein
MGLYFNLAKKVTFPTLGKEKMPGEFIFSFKGFGSG